jgi:hypothetical protein
MPDCGFVIRIDQSCRLRTVAFVERTFAVFGEKLFDAATSLPVALGGPLSRNEQFRNEIQQRLDGQASVGGPLSELAVQFIR